MAEGLENGKTKIMGIDVDISSILGDKIVEQYLAQLKPEDMEKIMSYIQEDLFIQGWGYDDNQNWVKTNKVKVREKDSWGGYKTKEIPIGEFIKNEFNNRIKEELKKKIEEIISATEYKEKIDSIANEVIDYAINGYKEDLKSMIRRNLVDNILSPEPYYSGYSLTAKINEIIDERFRG